MGSRLFKVIYLEELRGILKYLTITNMIYSSNDIIKS